MTARQIQEEFGEENTPENVRQAIRNKAPETRYQISHLIEPNDDRMPLHDAKGHKWRAIYWMQDPNATTKQNRAILRVSQGGKESLSGGSIHVAFRMLTGAPVYVGCRAWTGFLAALPPVDAATSGQ